MHRDRDWDALLADLPADAQASFEAALRRALARRLRNLDNLDAIAAPDAVRTQAVGLWRKRYMKGSSKAAKRRMTYARLRNDPTYEEVEHELLRAYWRDQFSPRGIPAPEDVKSMSFAEVCEAYRTIHPAPGSSGLDHVIHHMLAQAYERVMQQDGAYDSMSQRVRNAARTKDLYDYAHVTMPDNSAFHLRELITEAEVAQRVKSAHVVGYILRRLYGNIPMRAMIVQVITQRVEAQRGMRALAELVRLLLDVQEPFASSLAKMAKRDARQVQQRLSSSELCTQLAHNLLNNPHYAKEFQRSVELHLRVRESVPETPMEAYPLARTMQRRFVIHVGPTNSGKTHAALQALMAADSGVYLGPLRLLAYEQFESLNRNGCPCSLLTGEELVTVPCARHVASTIEMANFQTPVAVAVIDEAQMVADHSRGHSWTNALLGIPADEVHVCCAPHALQVVCELVRLCEDSYTIERHERLVPLVRDRGSYNVPEDVRPGDALVVFSRRSVHSVASVVNAHGLRTSLIYGALPYEVRHDEARKFDEGETDVVVATDAIGMGMNLPIRRVVFVEQEKFDGQQRRPLRAEEIQQIAGRAGRFGRYDTGLFQSTRLRRDIVRKYREQVDEITHIPVGIPQNIALVRDATLTDAIRQWMTLEQPKPFSRIDISRDLRLIGEIERKLEDGQATDTDTKLLVLSLASMPFDETDRRLMHAWRDMVDAQLAHTRPELPLPQLSGTNYTLASLEADYRYCDLLYNYERNFGDEHQAEELTSIRNRIARAIMDGLAQT